MALDIHGIGFKTADLIAGKLGIAPDSMIRAQAGVRHVLQELSGDGHCAAPWETLVEESVKLLEIPVVILEQAILEEITLENLVQEDIGGRPCLFLTPLQRAEVGTAASIERILEGSTPWGTIDVSKAIPWVAEKTGLTSAGSSPLSSYQQGCRHYRRPRCWKNYSGQQHSAHHPGETLARHSLRTYRQGSKTSFRINRTGSKNDPSPPGV